MNCTNADLNLEKDSSSEDLLKAAGVEIQEECRQKYNGGIQPGYVAITTPGHLQCKALFHVVVPKQNTSSQTMHKAEQELVSDYEYFYTTDFVVLFV